MTGMLEELHAARKVGLRQWQSGARDVLPRICCACSLPIWPGQRHHRVAVAWPRAGTRRIHYGRCPGEAPALEPWPPRRDGLVETLNAWLTAAVLLLFGLGMVLLVLLMAGWRP